MADTTRADTVRAALIAEFTSAGDSEWAEAIRTAPIRQVPFSYAYLVDWYNYLTRVLLGRGVGASVSGVGTDPHRGRVQVDVRTEGDRSKLEAWAARAEVPCGLVESRVTGPATAGNRVDTFVRPQR
jgi:hypothetical protein